MGFGSLLKMKLNEVPCGFANYVLENFDPKNQTVAMPCGTIDVTRESVNDMLGLPMGDTLFSDIDITEERVLYFNKWKKQFEKPSNIRMKHIKSKILTTREADMNFKLNFLAIMINSLILSSNQGKANLEQIKAITEDTNIRELDWCELVIQSLVASKYQYKPWDSNSQFTGPSAYLAVCIKKILLLIIIN